MSDYLSQMVGIIVAGVLAATAGVGATAGTAERPDDSANPGTSSPPRDPLADKVEPLARNREAARERAEARAGVSPFGFDIGWPQCPRGMGIPARRTLGKPMPPPNAGYVIVGLTNGPAFYPNPCLAQQVAWSRENRLWTSAYAVTTYPTAAQLRRFGSQGPRDDGTRAGRLFNAGYAQARINVATMRAAGLNPPALWIDVEPVRPPAPWSADTSANRIVLEGSIAAYRTAGLRLGVYSTQYLWRSVVGDARYGLPEWRAAGATSRRNALAQCRPGRTIQGGAPVLGQWTDFDYDFNIMCPGRPVIDVLREFFVPL